MKHRTFAPALGILAAALFAAGAPSHALAADPTGIWAKDDGSAKMEVKKCGRGICSKIVWLREPNDSRGKPLHDARNEDPSMRDRPIIGLPLFGTMTPTEPNTWVGNVYNPEEGHIYSDVKVTLVSSQQIVLRGCKAWLLCGEKYWTKSKLAPVPDQAEPIEVKAPAEPGAPDEAAPTPEATPEAPIVEAAREPEAEPAPKPAAPPAAAAMPIPAIEANAAESVAPPKMLKPTAPATQHTSIGLGFVATPASREPLPLSGENVPSMMVMTSPAPIAAKPEPRVTEAAGESPAGVVEASAEEQDLPTPARPPKPKPARSADATPEPVAAPKVVKPKPRPKPAVQEQLPWLQHP